MPVRDDYGVGSSALPDSLRDRDRLPPTTSSSSTNGDRHYSSSHATPASDPYTYVPKQRPSSQIGSDLDDDSSINSNPLGNSRANGRPTSAGYGSSSSDRSSLPDGSGISPFGMRNMGNTCYSNAALQCVLHCPGFVTRLAKEIRNRSGIAPLLVELASPQRASTGPALTGIKSKTAAINCEFHGMGQNDGHEFLRAVLMGVHDEVNRTKGRYREMKDIEGESDEDAARRWADYHREHDDSVVYDVFGGQLRHVTRCDTCGYRALTFDPILDVSLAMPKSSMLRTSSSTVDQLLTDFSKPEHMVGTEQFKCPKCQKARDARRQTTISAFPEILVIHLKRFSSSGSKNSGTVKYEETMTIPEVTAGIRENSSKRAPTFQLIGVVKHSGSSVFGHYTAYVLGTSSTSGTKKWYYCDDSSVRSVSLQEVLSESTGAYILFYQRRS